MATKLEQKGKTTTAAALGIAGGVLGIIAGLVAMIVGGAGVLLFANGAQIMWLSALGVLLGIGGVIGATMTNNNPEMATLLMAITGFGGFVALSLFWILPGALLVIGAVIAWSARPSDQRAAAP